MPSPNLGPELIDTDGQLHSPAPPTELERAAAALDTMTASVQELMATLQKADGEEGEPAAAEDENKAEGNAAAALREVAERAMSASKACESGELAGEGLAKEVEAIGQVLLGLLEQYPAPEAGGGEADAPPPPPEQKADTEPPAEDPFVTGLQKGADSALGLLLAIEKGEAVLDGNTGDALRALAVALTELAKGAQIEKASDVQLHEVFTMQSPDMTVLAAELTKSLRGVAERLATVAKFAAGGIVSDNVKAELAQALAVAAGIAEALPTQTAKGETLFADTLRDVAARALTLSRKADEAGYKEASALRELGNIQKLLGVLVDQNVQKREFSVSDLSTVLSADRMLNEFEAGLIRAGLIKATPAQPEQKLDPAVSPTPAMQVQAEGNPQTGEVKEVKDPVATSATADPIQPGAISEPGPNPAELLAKMAEMQVQIEHLRSQVAKARSTVPAPTAASADPTPTAGDALLFPSNYNSPEYREACAKQEASRK